MSRRTWERKKLYWLPPVVIVASTIDFFIDRDTLTYINFSIWGTLFLYYTVPELRYRRTRKRWVREHGGEGEGR